MRPSFVMPVFGTADLIGMGNRTVGSPTCQIDPGTARMGALPTRRLARPYRQLSA